MAELGEGSGTGYPTAVDTDENIESRSTSGSHNVPNDLAAAIIAVETELGTDPAGSLTDLKTRLAVALEDDGSWKHSHLLSEGVCRLKSGTYTGDGTVDQDITGVGFDPKFVWIWKDSITVNTLQLGEWTATKAYRHENAAGDHLWVSNQLISLDTDGFSVDDAGADAFPNANNTEYYYIAIG